MKALSSIPSSDFADLIDFAVVDEARHSVGTLHSLWSDQDSGALEFLGVKTGWLFGSNHVVPTAHAQVDQAERTIVVPYALDLIKGAPAIAADAEISEEEEAEIFRHYGLRATGGTGSNTSTTGTNTATANVITDPDATATEETTTTTTAATTNAARHGHTDVAATTPTRREAGARAVEEQPIEVALQEEQLHVGKREVEAGAVRLRKTVRTERVQVPVELRQEDVVVERVDAKDVRPGDIAAADFNEQNIDIPLHREEAVVAKETVVTGAVRVAKTAETETQTVSDTVRKEDVEVVREGGNAETTSTSTATTGTTATSTDVHKDERSSR